MWIGWIVALLGSGLAHAGPTDRRICEDVLDREAEAQTTVQDVRAFIQKDTRTYSAEVLDCLCANGAHVEILQAARRQMLRANLDPSSDAIDVSVTDPLTPAEYQVAIFFARRLEALANLRDPLVMHATHVKTPSWFSYATFSQILKRSEIRDLLLSTDRALMERFGQDASSFPAGRLTKLRGTGELQRAEMRFLDIEFRRFLYVDLEPTEDQALTLRWSLLDLKTGPGTDRESWTGYKEITSESIAFRPVRRPLEPACDPSRGVVSSSSATARAVDPKTWPASRIGTAVAGLLVAAGGAAAVATSFSLYDSELDVTTSDGALILRHPRNEDLVAVNIGGGVALGAGGLTAVLGLALPNKVWRGRR